MALCVGRLSAQVCVHRVLPRRTAGKSGEEDMRGVPGHPLPLSRADWGEEGDVAGSGGTHC